MDVSIVAVDKEIWRGDADMVLARSTEGEFGVQRGHIPFLAALVPGLVMVVDGTSRRTWKVPAGFLEASGTWEDYHVIVLVDDAEEVGDIDANEAARLIDEMKQARRRGSEEREPETPQPLTR